MTTTDHGAPLAADGTSSQFVRIGSDEADTLARIPAAPQFPPLASMPTSRPSPSGPAAGALP